MNNNNNNNNNYYYYYYYYSNKPYQFTPLSICLKSPRFKSQQDFQQVISSEEDMVKLRQNKWKFCFG